MIINLIIKTNYDDDNYKQVICICVSSFLQDTGCCPAIWDRFYGPCGQSKHSITASGLLIPPGILLVVLCSLLIEGNDEKQFVFRAAVTSRTTPVTPASPSWEVPGFVQQLSQQSTAKGALTQASSSPATPLSKKFSIICPNYQVWHQKSNRSTLPPHFSGDFSLHLFSFSLQAGFFHPPLDRWGCQGPADQVRHPLSVSNLTAYVLLPSLSWFTGLA